MVAGTKQKIENARRGTLRERKHIECSSLRRIFAEFFYRTCKTERRGFVAWIESAGNDGASPPADTRKNRNILFPIGAAIRDWLTDDSRACLKFPKLFPGFGVNGSEPS